MRGHSPAAELKYLDQVNDATTVLYERAAKFRERKTNPTSAAKVVFNRLLGGWFIVRGPHQTPIGGRFNSKAEALAHLNRNKNPLEFDDFVPYTIAKWKRGKNTTYGNPVYEFEIVSAGGFHTVGKTKPNSMYFSGLPMLYPGDVVNVKLSKSAMGKITMTAIDVEGRRKNPAAKKATPVKYRDLAKNLQGEQRVGYAVHYADRPSYHAIAWFSNKKDAVEVATEAANRTGKPLAVSRVQNYFGPL
jgi:hypothetical protein